MAVASESQGTQTATIGTEHSLATPTTNKTRVFAVDLKNLAVGDIVVLSCKTKVLTGGTVGVVYEAVYANVQDEPIIFSPPIPTLFGGTFTLLQSAGTGRAFDWAVYTLD